MEIIGGKKIANYIPLDWLDFVIANRKVSRCECGLLKSAREPACPHKKMNEEVSINANLTKEKA